MTDRQFLMDRNVMTPNDGRGTNSLEKLFEKVASERQATP